MPKTDTLCYRADPDEPLHARQQEVWEPLLGAFEAAHGITLVRVSGVLHRPQPPAAIAALKARLLTLDPFALAGGGGDGEAGLLARDRARCT